MAFLIRDRVRVVLEQCVRVLSGTFRVMLKINFRRTHSATVYMASQDDKAPGITEEEINVLMSTQSGDE